MDGGMAHGDVPPKSVIPRHRVSPSASPMTGSAGVSSTLQLLAQPLLSLEYWIARFRGPSLRLLQELRPQHQALELVGAAFDLVRIVGEVNVPDHGAALEHSYEFPEGSNLTKVFRMAMNPSSIF
jgi:hypothetical protein